MFNSSEDEPVTNLDKEEKKKSLFSASRESSDSLKLDSDDDDLLPSKKKDDTKIKDDKKDVKKGLNFDESDSIDNMINQDTNVSKIKRDPFDSGSDDGFQITVKKDIKQEEKKRRSQKRR